jgi:hypothetical protein
MDLGKVWVRRRLGCVPGGWIVGCFAFRPKNLCALWFFNNPLPFKNVIPTQVGIHSRGRVRERVAFPVYRTKIWRLHYGRSLRSGAKF